MSFLAQAKKPGEAPKPPILTMIGSPGSGKSSLAALFPNPVFIQAEEASTVFESWDADIQPTMLPELPKASDKSKTFETLKAQMTELATADHEFKTLVIDSVTALNSKLEQEVALEDGVSTVADAAGGFHKGYKVVMDRHAQLIYWCEQLRKRKNMAIVFLAHTDIQKIKLSPEEGSEYSVYSLAMHKDSAALYVNNSDGVYYIKKEQFVTGAVQNNKGQTTKFGRVMQTGNRILITTGDGKQGYVHAKSRYPLPPELELPLGENPVLQYIPFFNTNKGE